MSGSGAAIGMGRIVHRARTTLRERVRANIASCAVVVGTTVRGTAVPRIVASILLLTGTIATVSGLFVFPSLLKCHLQMASRSNKKDLRVMQMARFFVFSIYAN